MSLSAGSMAVCRPKSEQQTLPRDNFPLWVLHAVIIGPAPPSPSPHEGAHLDVRTAAETKPPCIAGTHGGWEAQGLPRGGTAWRGLARLPWWWVRPPQRSRCRRPVPSRAGVVVSGVLLSNAPWRQAGTTPADWSFREQSSREQGQSLSRSPGRVPPPRLLPHHSHTRLGLASSPAHRDRSFKLETSGARSAAPHAVAAVHALVARPAPHCDRAADVARGRVPRALEGDREGRGENGGLANDLRAAIHVRA